MSVWRTRPSVWTGSARTGMVGLTVAVRMDGAWTLLADNVWIRDRADALINTGMFLQIKSAEYIPNEQEDVIYGASLEGGTCNFNMSRLYES